MGTDTTPGDRPGDRPRRIPVAPAVAALAAVAVLVGGGMVLGLASWLLGADTAPSTTGEAVTGTSTDLGGDGFTVWARNADGEPVRWDPCSPVELVVASEGTPRGFLDDLEVATDQVAEATGLEVVVAGATDERPRTTRPPYQPDRYGQRWAPVLVAWASPDDPGSRLRDIDRGVATPIAVGTDGNRTYVTGQIVFNQDRDDLTPGFDDRESSWGATVLHELGHLLGLGHVDDPDELMAIHPGAGPVRFGPGDRRGLAAVGAEHGCLEQPPAQPLEVVGPDG